MNLIFNAPINNLSFGNVSYNVLREFYKQDDKVVIFPIGNRKHHPFNKTIPATEPFKVCCPE